MRSPRNRQLLLLGEVPAPPSALSVRLAQTACQDAAERVTRIVGKAPLCLHLGAQGSRPVLDLLHRRNRLLRTGRPFRPLPAIGDPLGWPLYWRACWLQVRRVVGCPACHHAPCQCEALAQEEREQLDLLRWMMDNPVFTKIVDTSEEER